MECGFTYNHFKECVNLGKKLGFSFYSMHNFLKENPKSNFIVMRHDVDLSLKHALKLAEIESSLGIKSTYFIRTGGVFDPFDKQNLEILKKISKFEHEIGFHYEFKEEPLDDFKKYFLKNKKNFEVLLNKNVYGAALHKSKKINNPNPVNKLNIVEDFLDELDLEYDAYSDTFFKKMKYISDSAYRWKGGCMCTYIKQETKLCILTHPIWWSATTTSLVSIMEELLE